MDRTTSLQTTAPTSLGPHSIHGISGAHDGNSAVGQKRKRVTQQPIRDEMEKRKKIKKKLKEEKIKVVGDAHSSSIPPPKPHVKAGDINVRSIKDTATVNGETDDAEGYYRVTEENRRIGDRYCIGRPLGKGTSGEVHEAFDKQTKSKCAIKITRVQDEARDELRVLQTLYLNDEQNQNKCIHLRDCFEFCNHICIVTDVLGKSLSDFLKDNESMTFPSSHIQSFARQLFVSVALTRPYKAISRAGDYKGLAAIEVAETAYCAAQRPHNLYLLIAFGGMFRSFWHTMISSDRHASHDSPYRTGQHMPLNQSRHAPLTSVATSALESRPDLSSPYGDDTSAQFTPALQNGDARAPGSPGAGPLQSPTSPYLPGMRSNMALKRQQSNEPNPFDSVTPGEIQMQSFQEGLPPPPPAAHSWKKIDRWAEENYEELYDQLSEGCTQNDVNELEHELDCSLPMEVRESLQVHDGQERGGRPTGIIFGCMLLDCEEIVQEWKNWRVVNEEYLTSPSTNQTQFPPKAFGGASSSSFSAPVPVSQQATNPFWRQELLDKQDSQPSRAIQKAYAHPGWIPLARDWGGNNLAVDLAPGPVGKWGQIIIFGRDYDCKYVVARSWAAFLATVADDMSSEKVFVDEETQELKLREFKTATVEPAYLNILRWRMDQKYGRKGPRRRPGSGPGTNANGAANTGSPYGSPTEERGRSPQRFPNRGPTHTQSPRGAVGKPSPLAQVTEENAAPKIHTGGDANRDIFAQNTAASERNGNLVEIGSPTGPNDGYKQAPLGQAMEADMSGVLSNATNKDIQTKSALTGLGVDGVDDMKSVEI